MRPAIILVAALFAFFPRFDMRLQQNSGENRPPCCQMVQEALRASGNIETGITRRELEEHWRLDGGVQFRNETRYIYPKCDFIRVDVGFTLAAPADQVEDSSDDIVAKVSKPYLAYPTMD